MKIKETKKITQPFGTKKSRTLLGTKNHATSPDQKITQPLEKRKEKTS